MVIEYTSFELSAVTESIRWTERAEWFFKDHNIEHEIVLIDFFNEPQVKCIQWRENLVVNIPIQTIVSLMQYSGIYHCDFFVDKDLCTLRFKEV